MKQKLKQACECECLALCRPAAISQAPALTSLIFVDTHILHYIQKFALPGNCILTIYPSIITIWPYFFSSRFVECPIL